MNLTISINNKEEALLALNIINTYIDNYSPNQENNVIVDEKEKLFIEFFSKLRFNPIKNIWYSKEGTWIIYQNDKNKTIRFNLFWPLFNKKFNPNYNEMKEFLPSMVKKHLKLNGYTIVY